MNDKNTKVFISYASEDKKRFVLEFAQRLRENGIDAWVDVWEMLPGNSLVDKIFEEGIKNAKAMIIVLSKFSVEKPWVREEMNLGFINRLSGHCKIIPVVIDIQIWVEQRTQPDPLERQGTEIRPARLVRGS